MGQESGQDLAMTSVQSPIRLQVKVSARVAIFSRLNLGTLCFQADSCFHSCDSVSSLLLSRNICSLLYGHLHREAGFPLDENSKRNEGGED